MSVAIAAIRTVMEQIVHVVQSLWRFLLFVPIGLRGNCQPMCALRMLCGCCTVACLHCLCVSHHAIFGRLLPLSVEF